VDYTSETALPILYGARFIGVLNGMFGRDEKTGMGALLIRIKSDGTLISVAEATERDIKLAG